VPRHGLGPEGQPIRHFSWVELGSDGVVQLAAQRWFDRHGQVVQEQVLLSKPVLPC